MKQLIALTILFTFAVSCGNEEENTVETVIDEPIIDELVIVTEESIDTAIEEVVDSVFAGTSLEMILSKSKETFTVPFMADTIFVQDLEFSERSIEEPLSFEDVSYLRVNCIDNLPTNKAGYILNSFCEIDSLRVVGEYENYVSNMDIGMIEFSDSYMEGIVEISEKQKILLWTITYSTYEACPYASGTVLFGTYLYEGQVINALVLAEESGGSDAPYWGETFVSSEITENSINTYLLELSNDYDEETDEERVESTENNYEITIALDELKVN